MFVRQHSSTNFFKYESILMWSKLHMVSVGQKYIQRSSKDEIRMNNIRVV